MQVTQCTHNKTKSTWQGIDIIRDAVKQWEEERMVGGPGWQGALLTKKQQCWAPSSRYLFEPLCYGYGGICVAMVGMVVMEAQVR